MNRKVQPAWDFRYGYSFVDDRDRAARIRPTQVYKCLGVANPTYSSGSYDPHEQVLLVLMTYLDRRYGKELPPPNARRAVFQELSKAAETVSEIAQKTGSGSLRDLVYVLQDIAKGDSAEELDDAQILEIEKIAQWVEHAPQMSRHLALATEAYFPQKDEVRKGRKSNLPLNDAILCLADIYEDFVDQRAYDKFSVDPQSGEGTSAFMSFLDATLLKFDPEAVTSKAALTSLVRRLLKARSKRT